MDNAPYRTGDVVARRYEVRDVVGAGPVGFVFRARDREVDVEVALKVINPRLVQTQEERRQFSRTVRLGRKLGHQSLIRVYEEGEDGERPFFTMQFLEGLTLRRIIDLRLQKGEFFSLREVEPILAQIASALDAAHRVGTHSNLKPENVIVLPDLLKVGDFGLGLAIPRLPFVQAVKQRRADRYLAPEYVQMSEVDQRADIYALGVIIGEMLTGLVPDGGIPELIPRNPEIPPQLEGLYRKALNTNPLARPKSAGELFREYADIVRRTSPPPLRRAAAPRGRSAPGGGADSAAPTIEWRRHETILDKPPPPVPDEPAVEEVPVNGTPHDALPSDTTQPLLASELEWVTAPGPPPPPGGDLGEETMLVPPVELLGEPTGSRSIPRVKRGAGIWFFALFTFAGLSLGAAGGYWLLGRMRQPVVVAPIANPPVFGQVAADPAPSPPPVTQPSAPSPTLQPATATAVAIASDPQPPATGKDIARRSEVVPDRAAERRRRVEADAEALRKAEAKERAQAEEKAARPREAEARAEEEKRKSAEEAARIADQTSTSDDAARAKQTMVAAAAVVPPKKAGCPDGMRLIPAGAFRMGTARDDPMMGFDERLLTTVTLPAYCIDVYEFPNRRGFLPRTGVSWADAKALCESRGKRLCTEEEWEKACKGPGNARYPYGNTFDAEACNTEDAQGDDRPLAPSGQFEGCRSGYGVADLSGNVAEWTASAYAGGSDMAQKGGSSSKPDYAARCSARKNGSPTSRGADVGFRCCADPS